MPVMCEDMDSSSLDICIKDGCVGNIEEAWSVFKFLARRRDQAPLAFEINSTVHHIKHSSPLSFLPRVQLVARMAANFI